MQEVLYLCVCVCVCVRERERDREGSLFFLSHTHTFVGLEQACQTQNIVGAAHGVLTAKNLSEGRSFEIYNTFCNTFL